MRVALVFDYDADIIDCPEFVAQDLKGLQAEFDKWLFDKNNDHGYWWYEAGEKVGCNYRSDAFIDWLNTVLIQTGEKAVLLEEGVQSYSKELPRLQF